MMFHEMSSSVLPPEGSVVTIFTEAILWTIALMTLGAAVLCGTVRWLSRRVPAAASLRQQHAAN